MISLAYCNSTAERDFSSCLLDIHSFPQFQFKTYTTVNEITVVRFLTKCECILNANARFKHAAFIIVLCTMILADTIKHHYKKMGDGSRTIRDLHGQPGVLYMMSSAQFHATLHSLMTSDRLCVQIAALAIVQLSAFGMTLRRKGLITQPHVQEALFVQ